MKPHYWSAGVLSSDAVYNGTHSLKLTNGQVCQQEEDIQGAGFADPAWWAGVSTQTRISFMQKGASVTVSVHRKSDDVVLTLTDNDGNSGISLTFLSTSDWHEGLRTFKVDTSGSPGKIYLKFQAGGEVYIDCVDIGPDFTSKWPSYYEHGPKSASMGGSGEKGRHNGRIYLAKRRAGENYTVILCGPGQDDQHYLELVRV